MLVYAHHRLARALKGKVLKSRATRQNTIARPMKRQSHSRNRPVNTPMPMYRKTTNSERVANDAKMYSAVICNQPLNIYLGAKEDHRVGGGGVRVYACRETTAVGRHTSDD